MRRFRNPTRFLLPAAGAAVGIWLIAAYLVLPHWWKRHERLHPALDKAQTRTVTVDGIPGDPLNLFIVAEESDLAAGLMKAGWYPADPVTLASSLRIAGDAVLRRPYDEAPISPLQLFGRKQDLAFEKPHGHDPRERHHVRFWQAPATDSEGRAAWWGAATFDRSVGLSHDTGEITHHIARQIDADRDLLLRDLESVGFGEILYEGGFQALSGRNGGGDPWQSDGKLGIAIHRDQRQ